MRMFIIHFKNKNLYRVLLENCYYKRELNIIMLLQLNYLLGIFHINFNYLACNYHSSIKELYNYTKDFKQQDNTSSFNQLNA